MTIEDSVIIGVAAICVFVAVLVLALRMSAQRRAGPRKPKKPENPKKPTNPYGPRMHRDGRLVVTAAPTHARGPGRWEERAASFGPQEDEEYGGVSRVRTPGRRRPASAMDRIAVRPVRLAVTGTGPVRLTARMAPAA